jgi:hypothetical protein
MDGNCIQYRVSGSQSEVSLSSYSAKYRLLHNIVLQNRQIVRSLFFQVSSCIFLVFIRNHVVFPFVTYHVVVAVVGGEGGGGGSIYR